MILGSDRRPKNNVEGAGGGARSDTIMLVRLDPGKEATAIMSLPRDLKVEIPGHGTDKINAAYELGGPQLDARDRQAAHRAARSTTSSTSTSTASGGRSTRSAACTPTSTGATSTTSRRVLVHQRPAGLPAAVRPQGAPVRALPPRGHRPRARRAPAGLPAPGQAADHRLEAVRQQRDRLIDDLRPQHQHRLGAALALGGAAAAQAGAVLGRPADPGDPLPRLDRPELRGDHAARRCAS